MGLPPPWILALGLACVALAAIPTRRLADAGIRPSWLATYLGTLVVLGISVVAFRSVGRFLVPILVVLYVAPLVVAPERIARFLHRGRRPPRPVGSGPGRNVTPPQPPGTPPALPRGPATPGDDDPDSA